MLIIPTILIGRRFDRVEPDVFRFSLPILPDSKLSQLSDKIQSRFSTLHPYFKPIRIISFQLPDGSKVCTNSLVKELFGSSSKSPLVIYLGSPLEELDEV